MRLNAIAEGAEFEGYRFDGILGAGGFGITYRATELMLKRTVAIKEYFPGGLAMREGDGLSVVPVGPSETETFEWGMERFRSEAQTLVAFSHANIVRVLRYFETNRTGYLVMEFVEGKTLAELLHPDDVLSEPEIMSILDPLLDGIQAVHEGGFLHRDIKPGNIFIRQDGSPVLIDFGAARQAFGEHSKSLTAIISEGYAPYEQYDSGGDQGPWSDIYALGGVLFRCMTGIRPPDAPSRVAAMVRNKDDPKPTLVSAQRENYGADLIDAVETSLNVREEDRPQTISAFREIIWPLAGDTAETGATAAPDMASAIEVGTDAGTLLAGKPSGAPVLTIKPQNTAAAGPERPAGKESTPARSVTVESPSTYSNPDESRIRRRIVLWSLLLSLAYVILYPIGAMIFAAGVDPELYDGWSITRSFFFDYDWIWLCVFVPFALIIGQLSLFQVPSSNPRFWSSRFLVLIGIGNILAVPVLLMLYRVPEAEEVPTFLYVCLGVSTLIFTVLAMGYMAAKAGKASQR